MYAADSTLLDLAEAVLPLVGQAAIKLGIKTKNRNFAKLGTLLSVVGLNVATAPNGHPELYQVKIKTILDSLEQACTWLNRKSTPEGQYVTLERIASEGVTGITLVDISPRLQSFLRDCGLDSILKLLEEIDTTKEATPVSMGLDLSKIRREEGVLAYPKHVNNALYHTLTRHTSCGCPSQHLKQAYLKLNETDQHEGDSIPFEVLFSKFTTEYEDTSLQSGDWHQTVTFVSSKPKSSRKVGWTTWKPQRAVEVHQRAQPEDDYSQELKPGEFCRHLKRNGDGCICFRLTLGSPELESIFRGERRSGPYPLFQDKLSAPSWSLADYIRISGAKMTVKERICLAYILAKSVWQYYGSEWMRMPWTHNDIRLLQRGVAGRSHTEYTLPYYPYLVPNFQSSDARVWEYCSDIDPSLTHRYPGVLALATILLEIIRGQLVEETGDDESDRGQPGSIKIRKRLLLAWHAAASLDTLDCNGIYQEVVKKCLDGRLFKEAPFDLKAPNTLEIRQSIIYREIVFPLKELVAFSDTSFSFNKSPSDDRLQPRATSPSYASGTDRIYPRCETPERVPLPQDTYFTGHRTAGPTINLLQSQNLATCAKGAQLNGGLTASLRPWSRSDFEIAIICALPLEYDAVSLLIDEYWDDDGDPYGRADGDQNTYTTGRIGRHNVVLVLLPNMGKSNAARAATSFRSSYDRIQLALLVGICGGMPADKDGNEILLGDVVISTSIFEYDLGRRFPNEFSSKNTTEASDAKANPDIAGLIKTLKTISNSQRLHARTSEHLIALQMKSQSSKYSYPGISEDRLYQSNYRHKHHARFNCPVCDRCIEKSDRVCQAALESWCSQIRCDESQLVVRERIRVKGGICLGPNNEHQRPLIHFGLIASGDTVMKSGQDRDTIALERNIIAFEMEGAGILDNLSCIVVKGVCDYADSHKNKIWQDFAAATAASAMKSLLERYGARDRKHY
ncbi:hypothetical protein TWF788_008125 [Orbilia oligospora]|uniref:Uncharacterized protein n=1 Tax=Orbilia oligospora TaxID=2813651 RepID=A0A7C8U191_ORBOL|nr:hypothetical protein TWF788_008125 [Orbilia oligospora]